jgi:hypothetical protein
MTKEDVPDQAAIPKTATEVAVIETQEINARDLQGISIHHLIIRVAQGKMVKDTIQGMLNLEALEMITPATIETSMDTLVNQKVQL